MIILKDTDSLQVLLGGTVAANQAVLYAAFVDVDAATFDAVAAGNGNGLTNSTTAVSWVASPVSGQFRQAKYLSLYNADTASVTATVRINDGTNTRILCKVTLATGERLEYTVDGGFRTATASGSSAPVSSVNSQTGAVVLVLPSDIIIALGDETTALTTGTAKVTIRAPRAMTLSKVKASLSAASTSGLPQFDVKKNGTSIFSTKPTIDVSEKTTETAATAAVLSTTAIAADDELTFDIVAAGTGATGAKITLVATAP
jgi:hypothetical protein